MTRAAVFLLALALWGAAMARDRVDAWIDAAELPPLVAETSTEVLDRNGQLLRAYTVSDGRWRLAVPLNGVDPAYVDMLLAYEDKRFRDHGGVDLGAAVRAAVQAVWNGRIVSGGSTLTMQVARLLEDGPTGTLDGKLRQIRVALALERQLTKDDILTLYLNRAPFGGNLEGVRAATRAYFGKEPRRLTPAEAALLVALPQSPETRRPDRDPDAARAARDRVLGRMADAAVIPSETAAAARRDPVPRLRRAFPALSPHMTDRVAAAGGVQRLTLDARLQAQIETIAARTARAAGDRLSVAVAVADHRTGEILASVGSAEYAADGRAGFVDMTRAVRSPGSTLKPLIYGLAFDQGLAHPETLIEDRATDFGGYAPQNFDGQFRGTVRVRDALALSLNLPVVTLLDAMGPQRLIAHLRRAGVQPVIPGGQPGLAIALGGVGVTLEDLVQLYVGLANGGQAVTLSALPDVGGARAERILSPEAAWQVADILSGLPPPAGSAPLGIAYKTGTSYGHRDAWAIGFDGHHVVGVWLGRPDGTPVPGVFGGELAAPLLFEAFQRLKPGIDPLPPPPPSALIVTNAELPQPLRRFRGRGAAFADAGGPEVAFPPHGARLAAGDALVLKVRDGRAPFTWLADGRPVVTGSFERQAFVPVPGRGFVTLSVIDAEGRAARSTVRLD
ncbi:penicillin-binding protein 1C [Anianabacter salinae]|uniref:penicillin-binding protein 1C n=1 Tax=Anianabacter salinae TaxID=2851023 RepID=UPI00225DD5D6|nr:penicillin-binding protein 1C [Anianabacter salinae]MBV0913405.1 penicillin-binding protein 1C [Anianabacter salinae]